MYLRKRKNNGVLYWSLVKSVRINGKPKQITVMSLGTTNNALSLLKTKKEYASYLIQIREFIKTVGEEKSYNYFVFTDRSKIETDVVKKVKPERLLLSYYYFKSKNLGEVIDKLEYMPDIILDSGAFSAFTKGSNIALLEYMNYIENNKDYIKTYISLDVIGDSEITYKYYEIMKSKGLNPMPVYHYGEDIKYLERYIENGDTYIALGGTVPISDKNIVANWINQIINKYPYIKFHLLGSSSKKITDNCNIYSHDSSTWIMGAVNGRVKHIPGNSREDKFKRAEYLMTEQINVS